VRIVSLGAGIAFILFTSGFARAEEPKPKPRSWVQAQLESAIYAEFGSVYAGAGDTFAGYHEQAAGLGLLGTLRLGSDDSAAPKGTLLLVGITQELSALQLYSCGEFCNMRKPTDTTTAARAGLGWDSRWIGVRGGVIVREDRDFSRGAEFIPDLALRLGPLDEFDFTLGLGAYDAPTTTRPGLYLGFASQFSPRLSAAFHIGLHDALDDLTLRTDATFNYRLAHALSLGLGLAVQGVGVDVAFQGHASLGVEL